MRKITAGLFISLDGVVEAPDQWHFPYFNEEMGAAVDASLGRGRLRLIRRSGSPRPCRDCRRPQESGPTPPSQHDGINRVPVARTVRAVPGGRGVGGGVKGGRAPGNGCPSGNDPPSEVQIGRAHV